MGPRRSTRVLGLAGLLVALTIASSARGADSIAPDRIRVRLPRGEPGKSLASPAAEAQLQLFLAARGGRLQKLSTQSTLEQRLHDSSLDKAAAGELLSRMARWREATFSKPTNLDGLVLELQASGLVEVAEPAYLHELSGSGERPMVATAQEVPPSLSELLGLPQAHAVVRGDEGDVLVAVVDGGTDWQHEDLVRNIWIRPGEIEGNGMDDDGNGFVDDVRGWSFAGDGPDPTGLPWARHSGIHGTHVTGLISADDTNGRVGIDGVSGGVRILSINAAHDVKDPQNDRVIKFGYQGILYAALSGADIVNLSWGRGGRWSHYENNVLELVEAMGMLVVAAAGNTAPNRIFYPAYYQTVFSVASIRTSLLFHFTSNAGEWIDVSAAGVNMKSTIPDNEYGTFTGTSMATAVTTGVAALVATLHPEWTPVKLREQLRWTTLPLEEANDPALAQKMGTGYVHAGRAVTETPSGVRLTRLEVVDEDGDGYPESNESVQLIVQFANVLAEAPDVVVRVSTADEYLTPLRSEVRLGTMRSDVGSTTSAVFELFIGAQAPLGHLTDLKFEMETPQGSVHTGRRIEIHPQHVTLGAQRIRVSLSPLGKIGFSHVTRQSDPGGEGIRRPGDKPRMLGGAFLFGDGPQRVSDGISSAAPLQIYEDFLPRGEQPVWVGTDGRSDELVRFEFNDDAAADPLGIDVTNVSRAYHDVARGGFVLSEYILRGQDHRSDLRIGLMIDWATNLGVSAEDQVFFDPQLQLGYALDRSGDERGGGAGVVVLEAPGAVGSNWFYNLPEDGYDGPTLYDPDDIGRKMSNDELWQLLQGDPAPPESPVGGLVQMVTVGPFDLPIHQEMRFVVAFVLGNTLEELASEVAAARAAYAALDAGFDGQLPARAQLLANRPNPFFASSGGAGTSLRFALPQSGRVRLRIFDVRGRLVSSLLDGLLPAGIHAYPWTGRDGRGATVANGVYHVLLETPTGRDHQSVTLLK